MVIVCTDDDRAVTIKLNNDGRTVRENDYDDLCAK